MSKPAQLFIDDLADGARRFTIDCPCSRTHTDALPEGVAMLGDDAITRITLARHWLECHCCDTSDLQARLRDVPLSLEEECAIVAQAQQASADGRRN